MRLHFGDCVFDSDTRELRRGKAPVRLSPKAFDLLSLLLEKRPKAVGKAEIHDRLWPDTHVSEASVMTLASEIRRALGDSADEPRYVRTVYGRGYAFCGEAEEEVEAGGGSRRSREPNRPASSFRLRWGELEVPLFQGENVIGRTDDAVLRIDNSTVSRRHARIMVRGKEAVLEDLDSKNGSWVQSEKVKGRAVLHDRDKIRLGSVRMTFLGIVPGTTASWDED